jgi:membrane protein
VAERRPIPWGFVFRSALRAFSRDKCTDLAAALTYFGVLSLFPALLALVSILGLIGQGRSGTAALLQIADQLAPGSTMSLIRGPIEHFASNPAAGLALVVGILGAIWSASGYVGAFGRALNRIYGVTEGRTTLRLRGMQLAVTISTLILVTVITLILVLSGPVARAIGEAIGAGETLQTVWAIVKWPVLAIALVLAIAILYGATPNVRRPRFRFLSAGACLAVVILGVATVAFGFYIANFSHYDREYGSLAGVIIFLLWIWIANVALLFGAEFDVAVERGRELAAGRSAETELLLPLKSSKRIRKAEDQRAAEILAARRIRDSAG